MNFARAIRRAFLSLVLSLAALAPAAAAELVMFETPSCPWCKLWHKEIGPAYPRTDEGRLAPLRRVNIDRKIPADLKHIRGVNMTPTFVLVDDEKRELGRLRGYPGADFFWPMLDDIMIRGGVIRIMDGMAAN
ncbi:MAG: transcriptional regulator [Hyphomicrobiales bacterium]